LKRTPNDRLYTVGAVADHFMPSSDRGGQKTDIGILK
jgi:hypothetical protein